jgi:hypothetical protein
MIRGHARRRARAYAARFPRRARCFAFGTTPEGREMVALKDPAVRADLERRLASDPALRYPVVRVEAAP